MPEPLEFDVFVCYSTDDIAIVKKLVKRLQDDGLKVWFDQWQIMPGDMIPAKVDEGLQRSRSLLFCMSKSAYGAHWTRYESYLVRFSDPTNEARRFIPVRLDDSPIPDRLKPFRYASWTRDGNDQEYHVLLAACRGNLDPPIVKRSVCMISSEFPPHILGGLGVHVTHLSEALSQFADVEIVLPYRSDRYSSSSPRISPRMVVDRAKATYDDPLSWLHFARHAFKAIEKLDPKPDVVHCHDWVTVLAGIRCRSNLNIPLVFHVHLPNRSPLCSSVENLGLLYADLVTVNSEAMAAQLRDRFPEMQIIVVPNGVDTTLFAPVQGQQPPKEKYVLFVGRLVEQKGVDHLLRAFVHVSRRFPDHELWIVGEGDWKQAYKRLAECLLIDGKVKFLGQKKNRKEIAALYQSASVIVVPSIFEPFGMTALEGMACGGAVVASRTGGLEEIIHPEQTGILVEPKDHLDMAQWIIRLLDDEPYRQLLGRNAASAVHRPSSPYQWASIARKYAEEYNKLYFKELRDPDWRTANNYKEQIEQLAHAMDPSFDVRWVLN